MTSRYQVFLGALPDVCPRDTRRMVFTADAGGRCEVFTWDAAARSARQVTDRPGGTVHCAIDADAYVWWFEEDTEGRGRWWYQPFMGGPRLPGLPGAPAGLPRGLAVTAGGTVAAAFAGRRDTTVLVGRRGRVPREVLRTPVAGRLGGITPDGDLVALAAAPDDEAAVTVLTATGRVTAVLPGPGGPGARLWCQGFSPRPGRRELLLVQDLGDRYAPATWTPETGLTTHHWCTFDTEITARWYPDRDEVLVRQDRHGRSLLHRIALHTRRRQVVPTPAGSLLDAAARPGGSLHYLWTDTAHPPVLRSTDGTPLPPPGPSPVVPGRHTDLWTPTPDGPVHTLLSLPETDGAAPAPAVFLVHGGPADQDRDAYDATVHSLVASGYAAVRVNYRGSTGYGPRWRRAFGAGVGHTQVHDLAAVRADLVRRGLVADGASALWGVSWGAYLVLLALGSHPGLWQAGVAVKPVADWVTAHRTTTPALRALDVRLFGGTPDEVPERYAHSSPLTYADGVTAPLLVVGATRDTKCPPEQIRTYLAALGAAGVEHEAMWLDTGHDGYDGAAHIAVLRRSLRFLRDRLPGPAAGDPERPPARLGGPRPR
ncbi:peptidase S9 [Streptomyces hygroscopicus]|uniref:S9 family peptidase n=1 Tax=Streptomyces hygroscopicus TaxID=1912 RepID=UPI00223F35E2|nr:prolyl oligopeptidase family serine peptidase [Streptomyces hygroscopicus]MCW7946091.1 peptidase S9 [Streptomyces hygroscopicus]